MSSEQPTAGTLTLGYMVFLRTRINVLWLELWCSLLELSLNIQNSASITLLQNDRFMQLVRRNTGIAAIFEGIGTKFTLVIFKVVAKQCYNLLPSKILEKLHWLQGY